LNLALAVIGDTFSDASEEEAKEEAIALKKAEVEEKELNDKLLKEKEEEEKVRGVGVCVCCVFSFFDTSLVVPSCNTFSWLTYSFIL